MTEAPISVAINAPTIASGWFQVLQNWDKYGVIAETDYGEPTKRINLTLHVKNPNFDQVHPYCPIPPFALEQYKTELTEEYADYQRLLPDGDMGKFEYTYAEYIYRQQKYYPINSHKDAFNAWKDKTEYQNNFVENLKNLRTNSRRHCGALWQNEIHIERHEDHPCWVFYKLELINEKDVILYGTFRSWDVFRGMPANLPAIVEGIKKNFKDYNLPYNLSDIYFNGMDAHIYQNAWDDVAEILNKNDSTCDTCGISFPKSSSLPYGEVDLCNGCRFS